MSPIQAAAPNFSHLKEPPPLSFFLLFKNKNKKKTTIRQTTTTTTTSATVHTTTTMTQRIWMSRPCGLWDLSLATELALLDVIYTRKPFLNLLESILCIFYYIGSSKVWKGPNHAEHTLALWPLLWLQLLLLQWLILKWEKKCRRCFFESLRRETYFVNITLTLEFGDPGLVLE